MNRVIEEIPQEVLLDTALFALLVNDFLGKMEESPDATCIFFLCQQIEEDAYLPALGTEFKLQMLAMLMEPRTFVDVFSF